MTTATRFTKTCPTCQGHGESDLLGVEGRPEGSCRTCHGERKVPIGHEHGFRFELGLGLTEFGPTSIGARILDPAAFLEIVADTLDGVVGHVAENGNHLLTLPSDAYPLVSSSIGPRQKDVGAYVLRCGPPRGYVACYLRREHALPVTTVQVDVWAREAYISASQQDDPDEADRIRESDCTHVIDATSIGPGGNKTWYSELPADRTVDIVAD